MIVRWAGTTTGTSGSSVLSEQETMIADTAMNKIHLSFFIWLEIFCYGVITVGYQQRVAYII
jgi:hypothetical protein